MIVLPEILKEKLNEYVLKKELGFKNSYVFIELDEFYCFHIQDCFFFIWDRKMGRNVHMESIDGFLSKFK